MKSLVVPAVIATSYVLDDLSQPSALYSIIRSYSLGTKLVTVLSAPAPPVYFAQTLLNAKALIADLNKAN